jgi:transcriptional regulator with XRE-family HTH domain
VKLTFTEWLETELLKVDMTKKELSRRIGYSSALVYQIAMGDRTPNAEFMIACATALHADPVSVLRLAGILPPAPGDTDDAWLSEAWALIQQTPAEARRWVMAMLRGVLDQNH